MLREIINPVVANTLPEQIQCAVLTELLILPTVLNSPI